MPKLLVNALTAATVKHAKPGRYGDGGGLFLLVKDTGMRSWVFRYKLNGKVRDMGLGSANPGPAAVTLAEAREKTVATLKLVRGGVDPLTERDRRAAEALAEAEASKVHAMTFKAVATAYVAANGAGWRNGKHRAQWRSTLETYAYPFMGELPIARLGLRTSWPPLNRFGT